jgi:ABC-type transport system involved in multi-copper enzyme maturation permease subunit
MKTLAIASITLREALRQKIAVNLAVFALLLISGSIVISELTFGEQMRIISDLALTSTQVFGTLIAVFLGAGMVAGDIQRRTLYPIIAKPVGRTEYLVGRYLGLLLTLTLNTLVMAACSAIVLARYTQSAKFLVTTPFVSAYVGVWAQVAIVAAIAILFSAVTNTTLAAMFALSLSVAGSFSRGVSGYWASRSSLGVVGYVVPNLPALDYKVQLVYGRTVPLGELQLGLAYAGLYVATALTLAALAFGARDFR